MMTCWCLMEVGRLDVDSGWLVVALLTYVSLFFLVDHICWYSRNDCCQYKGNAIYWVISTVPIMCFMWRIELWPSLQLSFLPFTYFHVITCAFVYLYEPRLYYGVHSAFSKTKCLNYAIFVVTCRYGRTLWFYPKKKERNVFTATLQNNGLT